MNGDMRQALHVGGDSPRLEVRGLCHSCAKEPAAQDVEAAPRTSRTPRTPRIFPSSATPVTPPPFSPALVADWDREMTLRSPPRREPAPLPLWTHETAKEHATRLPLAADDGPASQSEQLRESNPQDKVLRRALHVGRKAPRLQVRGIWKGMCRSCSTSSAIEPTRRRPQAPEPQTPRTPRTPREALIHPSPAPTSTPATPLPPTPPVLPAPPAPPATTTTRPAFPPVLALDWEREMHRNPQARRSQPAGLTPWFATWTTPETTPDATPPPRWEEEERLIPQSDSHQPQAPPTARPRPPHPSTARALVDSLNRNAPLGRHERFYAEIRATPHPRRTPGPSRSRVDSPVIVPLMTFPSRPSPVSGDRPEPAGHSEPPQNTEPSPLPSPPASLNLQSGRAFLPDWSSNDGPPPSMLLMRPFHGRSRSEAAPDPEWSSASSRASSANASPQMESPYEIPRPQAPESH